MRYRIAMALLTIIVLAIAASAELPPERPMTSVILRLPELQSDLERVIPEAEGFLVTGPLHARPGFEKFFLHVFDAVRVVCPDLESYDDALARIAAEPSLGITPVAADEDLWSRVPGFRGTMFGGEDDGDSLYVMVTTLNSLRHIIWFDRVAHRGWILQSALVRQPYAVAVGAYLARVDSGDVSAAHPDPGEYGLPDSLGLFAPPPDYVISGYSKYKEYLRRHAGLTTSFATGITAFVPTYETVQAMIKAAPRSAFANKEAAMVQEEYEEFFELGGDPRMIQTLTTEGYDTLASGEYFFAVSESGEVRFGREMTREEVDRIEATTGHKPARANHAFLFPGEAVLTAGAFFIDTQAEPKLVAVNAQSGHYFYSNITATIREDISLRSDYYLTTLGHFFAAMDRLKIPYEGILVSKL